MFGERYRLFYDNSILRLGKHFRDVLSDILPFQQYRQQNPAPFVRPRHDGLRPRQESQTNSARGKCAVGRGR